MEVSLALNYSMVLPLDLDDVTDEKVKELCTGSHVFFNCLGTTRAAAGSAVRHDSQSTVLPRLSEGLAQYIIHHLSAGSLSTY